MANPLRNANKFIVVAIFIFLMVAFLLPSTGLDHLFQTNNPVLGTVHGKQLRAKDLQATLYGRALVSNLFIADQSVDQQTGRPRESFIALPEVVLIGRTNVGEMPARAEKVLKDLLDGNTPYYHLLVREARANGIVVGMSQVDELLNDPSLRYRPASGQNILKSPVDPTIPEPERQALRAAVADLLAIQQLRDLDTQFGRVSQPQAQHLVSRTTTQLSLDVVEFRSPEGTDQTAPTEQELQAQFERFAEVAPGPASSSNPFGFGYRTPDQVKVQYMAVALEPIRQRVRASKPDSEWAVDAFVFYERNPSRFTDTPAADATASSTSAPASPAVKPFDTVKTDAINQVIEQETLKQASQVVERIRAGLRAEFDKVETAAATGAAVPPSKFKNVPIDSAEFLQQLAAEVQQQTGVLPETFASDRMLSFEELAMMPNFRDTGIPFALADNLKPLLDPLEHPRRGDNLLSLLQPSKPIASVDNSKLYVVRVVRVSPSTPATDLGKVRDRVTADVLRARLLDKAHEQARAYLAQHPDRFPDDPGRPVLRINDLAFGTPPTTPALERVHAVQFNEKALALFAPGDLSQGVVAVPSADRVFAARVVSRKLQLPSSDQVPALAVRLRLLAERSLASGNNPVTQQQLFEPPLLSWFDPKAIEQRSGFVSVQSMRH